MQTENHACLPRNRPLHYMLDGDVSGQHGGDGCNGVGLKFVVSPLIQAQRTCCSCIRTALTQRTVTATPQPLAETNAKDT